jgi:hypothetical protein
MDVRIYIEFLAFLPLAGIVLEPSFFLPAWGFGTVIGWVIAKVIAGKESRPNKALILGIAYGFAFIAGFYFWKTRIV